MPTIAIQAGTLSQPFFVPRGSIVTASGSPTVEYTTQSHTAVANSVALWSSLNVPCLVQDGMFVRLTAAADASVTFDPNPSEAALRDFRSDSVASGGVVGAVKSIGDTAYTLLAADAGLRLRFTSGSSITITVPAGLGAGFEATVEQGGAGQVTFSASGTTINNASSHTKTSGQHAVVALLGNDANVFTLTGQTGA